MPAHIQPEVGQIWQDKHLDRSLPGLVRRKIRVAEILPNGIHADVVSDAHGKAPKRPRQTTMMFKTLHASFELVSEPDSAAADQVVAAPSEQPPAGVEDAVLRLMAAFNADEAGVLSEWRQGSGWFNELTRSVTAAPELRAIVDAETEACEAGQVRPIAEHVEAGALSVGEAAAHFVAWASVFSCKGRAGPFDDVDERLGLLWNWARERESGSEYRAAWDHVTGFADDGTRRPPARMVAGFGVEPLAAAA